MKKILAVFLLVLATVGFVQAPVFAASPWTQEATYGAQAGKKLGFGFKNLVLGWTEVFSKPVTYSEEGKNVLEGLGMGLFNGVVYTAGGALHTVTFFIPQIDIPLPNDGVQSSLLT